MKLHLPVRLFKSVLSCLIPVACLTVGSGVVMAEEQVSIILGEQESLTIDYADVDTLQDVGGILQLMGGTQLDLSNCGVGDGKTYTLLTGVSALLDADGNTILLDSTNNAISNYFDTTQPGTGFWAGGTLQLGTDGVLQLVRHAEAVKDAVTITTRQLGNVDYLYYSGVAFKSISSSDSGGAIYGGTITLSGNGSVTFSENTTSSYSGGAIYGGAGSTIELIGNGSVEFSGNSARFNGGAIYGGADSTIELIGNGSVEFSGNSARSYGCAIYGDSGSTITLSGNGSVEFSGNSAVFGGAIYGDDNSTITLSDNDSVEFSGNWASVGGAIYGYSGSTITLSGNGSVTFSGNEASDEGGAIYGDSGSTIITLSGNESVTFSGNTASDEGGAIYGYSGSTITLSGNESVTFSGNTASGYSYSYGGAIYSNGNLSIRNNDSVLFEKNAEVKNGTYRLRSIYTGGSGDVISLSAAEGKSIEFRDSVYIASGSTVELNADYTDASGVVHKQAGDIIFTGKYTEQHLNELLAADGLSRTATAEEILNSRTTEVYAMTNLYGGRLRVEDGAIYMGCGITAMENSAASVLVKDAVLNHQGYELTFHAGTTLELTGSNTISGDVRMLENSTLLLNIGETVGCTDIIGNLDIAGGMTLRDSGSSSIENGVLMYVSGSLNGGAENILTGSPGNSSVTWVGNLLVLNYNESTFNRYFNGTASYSTTQYDGAVVWHHYQTLGFENCSTSYSGGAIYGGAGSTIELIGNGSVTFSGNEASDEGGAIYGGEDSTITLSGNGSVEFSGNSARYYGGAIYWYSGSTIELIGNGSVTFSGNEASDEGGAIYGSAITLSDNGSVVFSGNKASSSSENGARGGAIDGSTIELSGNGSVEFSGNSARSYGGAIYSNGNLSIRNNDSVLFEKNAEISGSSYRLRSVYAGGSWDVISLSAAEGKSIEFRDSVYIASGSTVELNADYTDADGVVHKQTGDIIFTGAYTEQHLNELLAADGLSRTATAEEILNSRTTEVQAMTNLCGGRLRVEDGAIYKGYGIAAMEGSNATVRVKDASLNHAGYGITLSSGSTLELEGENEIYGDLQLNKGSHLSFIVHDSTVNQSVHSGNLLVEEGVDVQLILDSADWQGTEKTLTLISSDAGDSSLISGSPMQTTGISNALWGFKDAFWKNGELIVELRKTDTVTWDNASGDGLWNNVSANWVDAGYRYTNVQNSHVILEAGASGVITLDGNISIIDLKVEADSAYNLQLTAGSSLQMNGELSIGDAGRLLLGTGITIEKLQNQGALKVAGDLVVSGEVTGNGDLSAYSLSAENLNAANLVLTDEEACNLVSGAVTVSGAVDIAGSLTAGGNLSGTSVKVGGLLIAASLETDSLSSATLRLTDAEACNLVNGAVSVSGAVDIAGSLTAGGNLSGTSVKVGGSLIAASLETDSLSSATLRLTDAEACNLVNGAVSVSGAVDIAGSLTAGGKLSGTSVKVGGSLIAASLETDSLSSATLRLTDAEACNLVNGAVSVSGAVDIAGSLTAGGNLGGTAVNVGGSLESASLTADVLSAANLKLTDANASNTVAGTVSVSGTADVAGSLSAAELRLTGADAAHTIGGAVTVGGAVDITGSLRAGGALNGTAVNVGGSLAAASLAADSLSTTNLELTDANASNTVAGTVAVSGTADVAGSLSAAELRLTGADAAHTIGGAVTAGGAVDIAGSLCAGGALNGTAVNVGGSLAAASLAADSLNAANLRLTDASANNTVSGAVTVGGAVDIAGSLHAGGALSGTAVNVGGSLAAASLAADSLSAANLMLTDAGAVNMVNDAVFVRATIEAAGSLTVGGAVNAADIAVGGELVAATVAADNLSAASVVLSAADAANSVSGDLTAESVSLASGASLEVGGTLTAAEVLVHGPAKVLQAGAFGAETMDFVLDRAALESLNLSYDETGTIARADVAMGSGFAATLNGGTKPVQAAAYVYDISVNGGAVQLTADYAHDGLQVWYRKGWVGESGWTDYYIAGYDAVDGVETIDLDGATVQGDALFIAYEEGVSSSVVTNGVLEFAYVDMGGGQFELGADAEMITDELYGKGETLVMHKDSVLNATELTLGTLALEGGELTVKKATINAMSGTEGTLNIESRGQVTVKSDMTLTGLENLGTLKLGANNLTVNALVDVGGDVTAGEVAVQSRGSRMASFDKLVADKVTVVNNISTGRYTDDLSVGDGSAIGELVAETLEVRGGTVTLGRTDAATEQTLLALDLQEDAALVLNQQTSLTVTDEMSATEGAELRLKQQASVSYGAMNISNRGAAAQVVVNAYDLANDSIQELSNAHVAVGSSDDTSIDYKLTNSSVENTGSGKLYLTHGENTFSSISAAGGDIAVLNQALELQLDELVIGDNAAFSAYQGEVESPELEAVVRVSQSVSFGAGAHINADLKLQSGVKVEMNGPVTMGSDLYLEQGMTLGSTMLETLTSAGQGQTVVLFSGIDRLYLCGEEQTDAIALSHGVSASEYFVNLISSQERSYYLVYDNEVPGEGVLSIAVSGLAVPEPTSSMLGLIGLVAFTLRRRRK